MLDSSKGGDGSCQIDVIFGKRKKKQLLHPSLLCKGSHLVTTHLCTIWNKVGNAYPNQKSPFSGIVCKEKEEEILENDSFAFIFDHMEGREQESF